MLDYISRLRTVQDKVADKIVIIPRIYTGKPRTTGDGYKGLLHQPDSNATPDLLKGVIAMREVHMRALAETGFSCADEMLYPEITVIFPICSHMLLSVRALWRISIIVSPRADSIFPSA